MYSGVVLPAEGLVKGLKGLGCLSAAACVVAHDLTLNAGRLAQVVAQVVAQGVAQGVRRRREPALSSVVIVP